MNSIAENFIITAHAALVLGSASEIGGTATVKDVASIGLKAFQEFPVIIATLMVVEMILMTLVTLILVVLEVWEGF